MGGYFMNRRILAPTVMLCGMLLFTGCASAGDSSAATKPDTSGSNAAAPEAEASVPADGAFETMTLKAAHVFRKAIQSTKEWSCLPSA